jgi:hypothetical protein
MINNYLFYILTIIILYFAYIYLRKLDKCTCVQQVYTSRLANVEGILLIFNVLLFLTGILTSFNIFKSMATFKIPILNTLIVSGIGILLLDIYFIYNTYYFSTTMGSNCSCANSWEKYYIYYQAISCAFIILSTLFFTGYIAYNKIPFISLSNSMISKSLKYKK